VTVKATHHLKHVLDVDYRNLALGHEVFEAAGATFVRNRALSFIYDANFVFGIKAAAPEDIDELLERAGREYALAPRLTFRTDALTPPAFETRLIADGYAKSEVAILILEGDVAARPKAVDIKPIDGPVMWQHYRLLKRLDWREFAPRIDGNPDDVRIPDGLSASSRSKCPPVQYFLAYEGGRAVGFCSAWEGFDGIGQVEDLFVDPAFRHRGIATALLKQAVDAARWRGAKSIILATDPADTPQHMYGALGWTFVTTCQQYGSRT
jgi:GNAT superfamily N-acetyltransferase